MLKIGDFSKLSQVSVKTLRYYDEIGLLKPIEINRFTNYRYYAVTQLPRLNRILALKDLGLTLDQIAHLIQDGPTADQIGALLRRKQAEIQQQVAEEQARLARVQARLRQIEQEGQLPEYEVVLKPVEAQQVAAVRTVIPSYDRVDALFSALTAHLAQHGLNPDLVYPWISLYHDEGYRERDVDTTLAAPLPRPIPPGDGITVEELPGTPTMASVVYRGPYEGMGAAYGAFADWLAANPYRIAGPNRQLYLQGPDPDADPAMFVTEIQFPMEPVSSDDNVT